MENQNSAMGWKIGVPCNLTTYCFNGGECRRDEIHTLCICRLKFTGHRCQFPVPAWESRGENPESNNSATIWIVAACAILLFLLIVVFCVWKQCTSRNIQRFRMPDSEDQNDQSHSVLGCLKLKWSNLTNPKKNTKTQSTVVVVSPPSGQQNSTLSQQSGDILASKTTTCYINETANQE